MYKYSSVPVIVTYIKYINTHSRPKGPRTLALRATTLSGYPRPFSFEKMCG